MSAHDWKSWEDPMDPQQCPIQGPLSHRQRKALHSLATDYEATIERLRRYVLWLESVAEDARPGFKKEPVRRSLGVVPGDLGGEE